MAKATTGKSVAKAPEGNKAMVLDEDMRTVPDFMKGDMDKGKESIGRDDVELPRIKLMQGLSPELEQFTGLRPGMFFHTATEEQITGPFRAVPIFMDRRFILWRPRESGGGILARADDGVHWQPANTEFEVKLDKKDGGGTVKWKTANTVAQSGLGAWGSMNPADPNSAPAATLMFNFLLAFPDEPDRMPAVLTFQRSSIKIGKRFNTKLKTTRIPLFGLVFEFNSFKDKNNSGQDFHNLDVRGAGRITDEEQYKAYKALHESIASAGLNIKDVEGLQDDAPGDNVPDDEPEGTPKY